MGFFREPKQGKGEVQQAPLCNLNLALPMDISPEPGYTDTDLLAIQVARPTSNLNLALPLNISPEPGYTDTDLLAIHVARPTSHPGSQTYYRTIHPGSQTYY